MYYSTGLPSSLFEKYEITQIQRKYTSHKGATQWRRTHPCNEYLGQEIEHHQQPQTVLWSTITPHLLYSTSNKYYHQYCAFCILLESNHTVCTLLCLASFPQHYACELPVYCCLCLWIIFIVYIILLCEGTTIYSFYCWWLMAFGVVSSLEIMNSAMNIPHIFIYLFGGYNFVFLVDIY